MTKSSSQVTHGPSIVFVIIEHLVTMTILIVDIFLLPALILEHSLDFLNQFKEELFGLLLLREDILVIGV